MSSAIILVNGPVDPFSNPKLCPTDSAGTKINSGRFGCSRENATKWHGGVDLKAIEGTAFVSVYMGRVTAIRDLKPADPNYKSGVGNFIIVRSDGFSIKYCHLGEISVKVGDTVSAGAVLGKTGKSGNAWNVPFKHLHIEVSTDHFATNQRYVDPEPYLKTKYKAKGSVAGPGDLPKNPNSPIQSDCPGLAGEDVDELAMTNFQAWKQLDSGSWNSGTSSRYRGGQGMQYRVKNINILGTTLTINSSLDGSRSLIVLPLTTVEMTISHFGAEPLVWQFDISTNSDAYIVTWELYSTWVLKRRSKKKSN